MNNVVTRLAGCGFVAWGFVAWGFIVLALAPCAAGEEPDRGRMARDSRPNVLIILVDDLGWGDLGCQGATDLLTPNVDRFFAESLRFDQFYASCCVCSPTRAALLTGCYPERVGVPGVIRTHADNNWGYLNTDADTLPQVFQESGYHTVAIGKWHLGLESPNLPRDRGFDRFHGFLGDMMDDYYHHRRHDVNYLRDDDREIEAEGHATDLFTDWAIEELEHQVRQEDPFLMYLAYNAPHTPIQPPQADLDRVHQRAPELNEKRAKLVALIEHLDTSVGRVLTRLDELDLADSTIVIFTSDNGGDLSAGANNGPWRDGKQSMYQGGLLVPFAVRWPGVIEPNTRISAAAMTVDVMPSLCEAAGVEVESGDKQGEIDGVSLLPLWRGEELPGLGEREMYFSRREGGPRYAGESIRAFIAQGWKLVQNDPFGARELYDLNSDPYETRNLAATEPERLQELARRQAIQIQRSGRTAWLPKGSF